MADKPTYGELERRVRELAKEVAARKRGEKALRRWAGKRLNCLNGIFELLDRGLSLGEMLYGTLEVIREGLQHPDVACVRIILNGQTFETPGLQGTGARHSAGILVHGRRAGKLEVCYPEERSKVEGSTFFKDEGDLINTIARRLGRIIEWKRAEEALRQSEEKFKDLIETTTDWVWEVDARGVYRYASPKVKDLLGYEVGEVLGKTPFDFMPEEEAERVREIFERKILDREPIHGLENENRHKAGHLVILETNGIPILDEKGQLEGYRGIDRDITRRRKMEEGLLETQKLELVNLLAGGIAHDFNNLLTGILGNISLVKMRPGIELEVYELLNEAERAAFRARNLTKQLFVFSMGEASVRQKAVISKLLQDTTTFALRGSNVRCEFFISDDLWPVMVDEGQISQVINNLALNARQAMPEGGTLRVWARNMIVGAEDALPRREGEYVNIAFEDMGPGIPKEHLQKIFGPYFSTKEKGRGLGLAVAYSIIKKHEGYIEVKSEPGTGARFDIYLPASRTELTELMESTEVTESNQLVGRVGKILLMDDEEIVRKTARRMLNHIGYHVELAKDGAEAVALYRKARESGRPFDAVILDLTVPGGPGGEETMKELMAIDPRVKGIVSSGYFNHPLMTEFKRYGFHGGIAKPYIIEELSETLRRVIIEKDE